LVLGSFYGGASRHAIPVNRTVVPLNGRQGLFRFGEEEATDEDDWWRRLNDTFQCRCARIHRTITATAMNAKKRAGVTA
jgi:hypothetical protein